MTSKSVVARAHLGVAARHFADQPEKIENARRDLAAAKIEDYISRVVAEAPPLSPAQCERLALLLRPAVTAGGFDDAA